MYKRSFEFSFSSITGGVSRTFWVSKKSPLLAVGAISWKPKTSAKPLQLYYLGIRLVSRQSCTHTPVIRVRTPPSCRSIYRCSELQNFEHKVKDYPIGGTPLACMSNHVCSRDSFQSLPERKPNRVGTAKFSLGQSKETHHRCFRDGCLNKGFSF